MESGILILQLVLAAFFLVMGGMKLTKDKSVLTKKVTWAEDYSSGTIKMIGFLEVLGALGMLIPQFIGVEEFKILVPIAATALSMVMAGAIVVHLQRDEFKIVILNIFIIFMLAGVGFNQLLTYYKVDL